MKRSNFKGLGKIDKINLDFIVKGFPSKVKPRISKNVNSIIRSLVPEKIKVGRTSFANLRKNGIDYASYKEIIILYCTESIKHIKQIEDYYIRYTKRNFPEIANNIKSGSAGRVSESAKGFLLYLVIK